MKLKNKKTGEIVDMMGTYNECTGIGLAIDHHDGNPTSECYRSLAELNEEWEDYDSTEMTVKCAECGKLLKVPKLNDEDNVYGVCAECQARHLIWK